MFCKIGVLAGPHCNTPRWSAAQNSQQDEETCFSKNAKGPLTCSDVVNRFLFDLFVKTSYGLKTCF